MLNPEKPKMGVDPDTKDFEAWLTEYLEAKNSSKGFNRRTLEAVLFWIFIALMIGGIIGCIVIAKQSPAPSYPPGQHQESSIEDLPLFLCVATIILSGIFAVVSGSMWNECRKDDYRKQCKKASYEFYDVFWNYCYKDQVNLTFDGMKAHSQAFTFHSPNGEKIIWKTYIAADETSSKPALHAQLNAYSQKLSGCEGVFLTRCDRLDPIILGKTYDLPTPSMSFNKRFKIRTVRENQHAAGRIFDPSVVKYFDDMTDLSPRANDMAFHDGYVTVEWSDLMDGKAYLTDCINDFSELKMNSKNAAKIITQKIKGDYVWFFENLAMLQPFELYQF